MLEQKIEQLTAAVIELTKVMQLQAGSTPSKPVQVEAPPPVVAPTPAPVVVTSAPAVEVSAPAAPAAPFSDVSGMIQYVMGAYKTLGPQKGAEIQGVLTNLGYQNINEVKPEHFGALFAGIEALK